jgi:prepilin-type N-terminal cleavage/methylation domain-containing protein
MPKFRDQNSGRSARGFTLLELLMVVAVGVIIGATAIPSYMGYLRNYRANNDAHNIAGLMSIARMRAGADFARAAVSCNSSSTPPVCKVYTLQFSPSVTGCSPLTAWTLEPQQYVLSPTVVFGIPAGMLYGVQGQSLTAPAQVYAGQTSPYTIYFNSRGWPVDCNGNLISNYALYLQDAPGAFNMAVGFDPSGRAQVYVLVGSSHWSVKD